MTHYFLIGALVLTVPCSAQQPSLPRIDSLLLTGKYEQARTAVAEWQRAHPARTAVAEADRAHALYLEARLTPDASKAQDLYLSLVFSHPTASDAPDALLRIGQISLASGQSGRAVVYLERLVTDYPGASNLAPAHLWLARAQLAAGNTTAACRTSTRALELRPADPEAIAVIQEEQRAACTARPSSTVAEPVRRADTGRRIDRSAAPPAAAPERSSRARYALQTGAFMDIRRANSSAAELQRLGFDARVVYVPGSELARVRIGRFDTVSATAAQRARLRKAGITTIVVGDAHQERAVR